MYNPDQFYHPRQQGNEESKKIPHPSIEEYPIEQRIKHHEQRAVFQDAINRRVFEIRKHFKLPEFDDIEYLKMYACHEDRKRKKYQSCPDVIDELLEGPDSISGEEFDEGADLLIWKDLEIEKSGCDSLTGLPMREEFLEEFERRRLLSSSGSEEKRKLPTPKIIWRCHG